MSLCRTTYWLATVWLTAALLGCGFIADPNDPGKPLWTIHGKIYLGQEGLELEQLRTSLLWMHQYDPDNPGLNSYLAQELHLNFKAPTSFSLEFFDLPLPQVMRPAGDFFEDLADRDLRAAVGAFYFYLDRNQNQQLDLLPPDAPTPIDYLLGPMESYSLYYFEGDVSGLESVKTGVNLFQWTSDQNFTPVSLDTEITSSLYDYPEMQYIMCQNIPPYQDVDPIYIEVPPEEVPYGYRFQCSADGRSLEYSYKQMTQEGGVCSELKIAWVYALSSLAPDQLPPENWPCLVP